MSNLTRRLRQLIWLYFWLLLLEGVLRKWVLPSLSGPLLLIRVPVLLLIIALAVRGGLFLRNALLWCGVGLGFLCLLAGLIALPDAPSVALFGLQANFLHLALIFIVPKVFTREDVLKIGRSTLIAAVPMAFLMVFQFLASPDSKINVGAGGSEGGQIVTARGHIRAAGTFSYILGPVIFYAMAAAFLIQSQFVRKTYPQWLVVSSALATVIATVVSGSRSQVSTVFIVLACGLICGALVQIRLFWRLLQAVALIALMVLIASQFSFFSEGTATMSSRFGSDADTSNNWLSDFLGRAFSGYTAWLDSVQTVPWLGYGLGAGTIAGGQILTGGNVLIYGTEDEWTRIIFESGPILGIIMIFLRVCLTAAIGRAALIQARSGNTLPLLLWAVCAPNLLNGQFGQATILGFASLTGGLCVAAMREETVLASNPAVSRAKRRPFPTTQEAA